MRFFEAYPTLRVDIINEPVEGEYRLQFVHDNGSHHYRMGVIGKFVKQADETYTFEFSKSNYFKEVIEADEPIRAFLEIHGLKMKHAKKVEKRRTEDEEFKEKIDQLAEPREFIVIKPSGQGAYKALYLEPRRDEESGTTGTGSCRLVAGGIIWDEDVVTVGVAQKLGSESILLQLDSEKLFDLIQHVKEAKTNKDMDS